MGEICPISGRRKERRILSCLHTRGCHGFRSQGIFALHVFNRKGPIYMLGIVGSKEPPNKNTHIHIIKQTFHGSVPAFSEDFAYVLFYPIRKEGLQKKTHKDMFDCFHEREQAARRHQLAHLPSTSFPHDCRGPVAPHTQSCHAMVGVRVCMMVDSTSTAPCPLSTLISYYKRLVCTIAFSLQLQFLQNTFVCAIHFEIITFLF